MIAAVIVTGVVAVVVSGVLAMVLQLHARERREWVGERRMLVDRAIATHVGEIVTLDRTARPSARQTENPTIRPVAEGL